MRLLYIFTITTLLLLCFTAQTFAKTWDGGGNNLSWSTANNWNPNGVPAANEDIVFSNQTLIISNVPTISIGKLRITNNSNITLRPSTGNERILTVTSASNDALVVASGSTLNITGIDAGTDRTLTLTTENTIGLVANITGTLVVGLHNAQAGAAGIFTKGGANAVINFNGGSTYQHAVNAGTIPTASWSTTSTCNIVGMTTTNPSGLNQTFGNFTWNCTGQSGTVSTSGNSNVNGNFTLTAGTFSVNNGTSNSLSIAGNYSQTGGVFDFNAGTTGNSNVNIGGNFSNTAGAQSIMTNGAGAPNGTFIFNGNSTQTFNMPTVGAAEWVKYTINSGSTVQLLSNFDLLGDNSDPIFYSNVTVNGTLDVGTYTITDRSTSVGASVFTLNTDATFITAHINGVNGSIPSANTTKNFNTGANYKFNGTLAQVTGVNLTQNTPANLTFDNPNTVTLSAATTISGNLLLSQGTLSTSASNFNLNIGGNWTNNGSSFTPGTSSVTFTGNTASINGTTSTTFYDLTINKTASNRQNLGVNTIVTNLLTLTSGILDLSNYNFVFGANAIAVQGSPSVNNMIVASGTGRVRKLFTTTGTSFQLPIGEETGTADYSPITIAINSATLAPGALVEANVIDAKHPNNGSITNYLTRYWTVSQVGITNMNASISAQFVPTDTVGPYSNIITSRYITPVWVEHNEATATTLSASNLVAFGDFTGRNNVPILNATPLSLTNFTYVFGQGPSTDKNFAVSGSALSTNITILPTDSFEISTLSGASFTPTPIITVNVVNREVSATTIYVRMKAGLNAGNIPPSKILCSSVGVTSVNVNCSGSVTNVPLISPSVSQLTDFSYRIGAGPSAVQTFTLNGSYLTNNVVVTAPTNYEIQSGVSAYGSSLTFTPAQLPVQINVRLKAGLLVSNYTENIILTTTSGVTQTVQCVGAVNTATVAVSKFTLAGFIYTFGQGPSSIQSFVASGTSLTANLVVTPPTNFEISTDSLTGYTLSAINIIPASGAASSKIYVRMKSGLALGNVATQKITVTSTGAIFQTVACSGQVVDQPTTISSIGTLNGFFYISGAGPSVKQAVTVSATGLSTPITLTAPLHYEISLTGVNNTFVSNGGTLSIPNSAGKVNAVPVYIRLKSGFGVGDYNAENIQLTATGAATINIVCNGKVVNAPTIVAGPAGLDPTCANENITLTASGTGFTNLSWTGPNSFYSTTQNPALGVVTSTNNGTYTVTGSSLSGVNLITNGDFELGNTGFGSSYLYQRVAPPAKGNYWISANPKDMYSGFCDSLDHTISGTQMMIVDGGTTNGMVVWSQTVEVAAMTDFQFSFWMLNIFNYNNDANKAKLQLYINNMPIGIVNTAPAYGQPWAQYRYNTNSGSNTSLQLTLINTSTEPNGNDFALDDIDFQQVVEISSSVVLNVVPTLTPAVVVTASENPVFTNTIVTYTASPTNGGANPTYQWKVNGINQGLQTSNATFDYTPLQGDSISCEMTSNYECISPNTATNFVKMTVNPRTNYWRGNISTNWGTPENWTGGYVPAAGDDVEFAKKSNNNGVAAVRNLQLDINRTIGFLINDSASLAVIIPANLTLIVNNSIQSTVNPDKVIVKASSTLANGSIIYRNTQNFPVYGTVEMYSPASIDRNGGFNNVFSWQFFGIPIDSLPTMPTFYGSYVRELIESDKDTTTHWKSLTETSIIKPFIGYELCQQSPKFYTFKGKLVNSNYNSGQFVKTVDALYPGQHLFANPYTAAMDIKLIEFGSGVEATAYLYSTGTFLSWRNIRNLGLQGDGAAPGQYLSVPKNQAGEFGISRQVPSMGTLMVRVPSAAASTPLSYVNFNYNNITMGNFELQRAKASSVTDRQTTTTIEIEGENGADKIWLMSHESYSRGFDNGYDGKKMTGNALSPQFYAVENDGKYQINSVDDINNTTFSFQAGQDKEYKMTIKHDESAQAKYNKIYLHDLVENKIIDISANGTIYNFTATSTSKPVVRFKILSQSTNEELAKKSNTKVYYYDNKLFVQNFSDAAGKVYVYDISGRTIGIKSISANENIQIAAPKQNTYLVKIVVGEITETTKLFLQ